MHNFFGPGFKPQESVSIKNKFSENIILTKIVRKLYFAVWKCRSWFYMLPSEGMDVSVIHCPWRAWKCSTWPMEAVEVSYTAHGRCGSILHYLFMASKCSMLPMEGMEVFHNTLGRHRCFLHCPRMAWKCSMLPIGVWKLSSAPIQGNEVLHAISGCPGCVPC